MTSAEKRQSRVQGPMVRADGSRFWICRLDARRRMVIPKEVMDELGWPPGDCLQLEVREIDGTKVLEIRKVDPTEKARNGHLKGIDQ